MSEWCRALSVPIEEDLLPLSALLHRHGLPHRVIEEAGRQVLLVQGRDNAEQVDQLYRRWRAGEVEITLRKSPATSHPPRARLDWRTAPVMLGLIAVSVCVFLLVYVFGYAEVLAALTFPHFILRDGQPLAASVNGQYWRLVTPAFLHFGWLHIAFNCLWLWELGRRVEIVIGHFNTLMLCLVIALVCNISQFVYSGAILFGGMSGVVYGLLGFAWIAALLQPRWSGMRPMQSVIVLMLGWLVVCMVGLVEALGFGSIANAAHLAGLLSGVALGALFGLVARLGDDSGPGAQV